MMAKEAQRLRLDLPVLLPDAPDEADACVGRLVGELSGREGMERVHVVPACGGEPAKLCIHYDPHVLSLARVRGIAEATGARLTERFAHVLWDAGGLRHQRRARIVSERLRRIPGVVEAEASASGLLRIEFDREATSEQALRRALDGMGVQIRGPEPGEADRAPRREPHGRDHGHEAEGHRHEAGHGVGGHRQGKEHAHAHGGVLGESTELVFALACGALLAVGYLVSVATGAPAWLPLALYAAAYGFGGFYTLRDAIDSLRFGRFEIDTLMLVAAAGAAALGEWAEGALLLFLFSLGHSLEHYAMGRARRAIEALAELAPRTAEVRRDGEVREMPVEELAVGDTVVVRPNARIPADGFVVRGASSVDQAPVTGESVPVDKRAVDDPDRAALRPDRLGAEHRIFAGTINGSGAMEVRVARRAADTTLARVVRMVSEAEAQKSPTQRFTDRFERVFVPAVLAFVVLLLFAWVVVDEPFRDSFYRAMAVLVAASPCALAIAIPSAVLSGVARAARGGVLVKGGGPLENLGTLGAIAFDKTGTLTEGKPRVTDVVPAPGAEERELLGTAVAVEALSDHPLAAAVVRDGRARLGGGAEPPEARDLRSITGRGLAARINDEAVFVGKAALFAEVEGPSLPAAVRTTVEDLEVQGRTTMVVRRGGRYLGVLGLMDTPRPAAARVVARLRELGISRMIMISGDNRRVAEAVARQVGIDEAWGDLMPEDKVEAIRKLRAERKVAMVGDGVNDAPAMANATVGIAMGAAGSDVALETADVALMADDLGHLPFAVGLSRRTSRIIRQNLWLSLGMVAVLIPATLLGLQIGVAVLFHEGSTLVVVANALRLLAYRDADGRLAAHGTKVPGSGKELSSYPA
ncbi:heavy metal translocating P-type ATPase [Siccirubricoccus phaeus]|uniref:heavy metal translocating P-type ATPase n=1 Tax=Siccirubricoccus phaeus TaxID=2595053 RepID=UPI001A9CA5A2|nr:heavy metal translocating P-type ATPase [Siccirubricoccus phaeus]